MAPLPPNSTPVLYMDYTTGRVAHTLSIRVPSSQGIQVGVTLLTAALATLSNTLPDTWTVTGWRYRAQGSDITLPYEPTSGGTFTGANAQGIEEYEEARELTLVGRSTATGRRWELSLYGAVVATPADYRYSTADMPPALAAFRSTFVDAAAEQQLICIDGDEPVIYPYVNINFNSYWEERLRRS